MSTELMIRILTNEGFKFTENECCICYEKFIDNITFDELLNLRSNLFKEKYNLNDDTLNDEDEFFGENPVRCYNDRFECLTCRKVVCDTCIQHIPQENGATGDFTEKITCPMCRTEDYRFQIGSSNLSVEILRDIKNFKNK
jgi:hypothetical protein